MTNFNKKLYLIFASDKNEVIKVMQQIELKGIADKTDLQNLAHLGMPLFCCIKEHQMRQIHFSTLETKLTEFANQDRFTKLRERFFQIREFEEVKKDLVRSIKNLPIVKYFLKCVNKCLH